MAPGQFNSSQETPYLERDFLYFFFLETLQTSFLQLEKVSLILLTSCVCPGEFDARSALKELDREVGEPHRVKIPLPLGS